jgi:hypothetical protein
MSSSVWCCPEIGSGLIAVQPEGDREVLCLSGEVDGKVVADFQAVHPDPLVVDAIDAGGCPSSAPGARH